MRFYVDASNYGIELFLAHRCSNESNLVALTDCLYLAEHTDVCIRAYSKIMAANKAVKAGETIAALFPGQPLYQQSEYGTETSAGL